MKKKILIILAIILLSPLISSVVCTDSFSSTVDIIQICGYCQENNGSVCSPARACNFTIYYHNFSLYADNLVATNNGDGSFTHNITQQISGGKNLSDGLYLGRMDCDSRSYQSLSFMVSTTTTYSSGYSGIIIGEEELKPELLKRNIPDDIKEYWKKGVNKISNFFKINMKVAGWILVIFLLIFIFIIEIYRVSKKIKLRKNFK